MLKSLQLLFCLLSFLLIWNNSLFAEPPKIDFISKTMHEDSLFSCSPGWQGTVLVDSESLSNWSVENDIGSSGNLQLVEGLVGKAVQLNWNIGSGEWVQGKYTFTNPVDLSHADLFGVTLHGGEQVEAPNAVAVMFADVNNVFYGYNMEGGNNGVNQIDRWLINVPIPKKLLTFFFSLGAETQMDWSQINRFFIVVKKTALSQGGGTGHLTLDNVQYDTSANWPRQTQFEKVTANSEVSSNAVNYLISQQKSTGLFLSWKEEIGPNAWLYDQALVLIALTREGNWENGMPKNSAAQTATRLVDCLVDKQKSDGHWARSWNPETGDELTDDGWVGDQAWWITALSIYYAKSGTTSALSSAQLGAQWLAAKIGDTGKIVDSTEGNVDSWWAMMATSRYSDAAKLKSYLLNETTVWDSELNYWWRGYSDPVVAMDTATWLSAFTRHALVNQPDKGMAALSFVRKTLVTTNNNGALCGFDGMGPVSIWNEGTAQYVAMGGKDAQTFLNMLISQQNSDGSMPGSPDNWSSYAFGWLSKWNGLAPTAWLYYAITGPPFPGIGVAVSNNCTATLSDSLLLHVPLVTFNGQSYSADFLYSQGSEFILTNATLLSDTSSFSNCTGSSVSSDFRLHIPVVTYSGVSYWADMQYTSGVGFTLTGVGFN